MKPRFDYKCTSCDEINSGEYWDTTTFHTVVIEQKLDDEAIDNLVVVSIHETKWDGWTWFTCPSCGDMRWDDPKDIVEIPIAESNKAAKHLLEERY